MSLKMMGIGFILVVIGFFMALKDGQLKLWGKHADAQLTEAWVSSGMSRRGNRSVAVEYRFKDAKGEDVLSGDSMSLDWTPPADGNLKIVYLESDPKTSRIAGHIGWGWLWLLGGGGVLFALGIVSLYKTPIAAEHRRDD